MSRRKASPFAVKLGDDELRALTRRLVEAIRIGTQARSAIIDDGGALDFAYALYEQAPQGRTGADLTSPIGTQMVDTLTAIASKAIFTEPFLIAEGFGDDAKKAPAVEEYMQWRAEEMRLQQTAGKAVQQAFIEEGSILEACEDAVDVHVMEVVKAAIARDDLGNMLLDETGKPIAAVDEAGDPVEAEDREEYVEVQRLRTDVQRRGASVRNHSLKDFLFLPGHARDLRDVWGMASRFYLTVREVKAKEQSGEYVKGFAETLGTAQERQQRAEHDRQGVSVDVDHAGTNVEKELWQIQFYADLGEELETGARKGLCFYRAVVSVQHEAIGRLEHDWIGRFRYVYPNPYPRANSVYGYSLVLHKLLTTIEAHTAWRNMNCDRGALIAKRPLGRINGSSWDPQIQPIGPNQVIDLGDKNEVFALFPDMPDVSQHAFTREREFYEEAARIVGVSDILASVNPKVSRTLGENEMVTEQSFTRAENPIRNIQEAFEDLGELIHAIEVKTLEEMEGGVEAPAAVAMNVKLRGKQPDNADESGDDVAFAFTADMIKGRFRFKPRGSVETADPNRRINNFVNMAKLLGTLAQMNPLIAQRIQSPPVADSLMQEFSDLMKVRDKQAYLAPMPPPMLPPGMGAPGAPGAAPGAMPPGLPPGLPGMPGGAPSFGDDVLAGLLANAPEGAVQ